MSESRVRENLTHGLMRGKRVKPSNPLYTVATFLTKKNAVRIMTIGGEYNVYF